MLECLIEAGIQLTKIKNRMSLRIFPCGTPERTGRELDVHCLKTPLLLTMSCHLWFTRTNMLRSTGKVGLKPFPQVSSDTK